MKPHPQPASGELAGSLHFFPLRVYYEDTDLSGIVYHANYLRWFERARSDLLRLLGIDQRTAAETGIGTYAVADMAIKFAAPAKLDDDIVIVSRALGLGAASVRLLQQAFRGERMLAEANVRVGFVAPDGRPRRQPAEWQAAFRRLQPTAPAEPTVAEAASVEPTIVKEDE